MPKVLNPDRKLPRPDDPNLIAIAVQGFQRGHSWRHIAARMGIARPTIKDWLRLGHQELEAYNTGQTGELGSYGVFAAQCETAYADFEHKQVEHLDHGKESGGKGWIPALAHLRSVNPEWSETQHVETHSTVDVTHHLALPGGSEQELLTIVQAALLSDQKLLPGPTRSPSDSS